MPFLVLVLIVKFFAEVIRVRKAREAKPQSLCVDCFYAHVQYGANGRRAISCTYGGAVRPMKLDVLYCADYRARNVPMRVLCTRLLRPSKSEGHGSGRA